MCRISLPRIEMWSRLTGEPPLTVIFAVLRLVFICGETEAIEPLMMVPELCLSVFVFLSQLQLESNALLTGLELHCDGLVGALHEESAFSSQSGPRVRLQAIFQHMACARAFSGRRRT
jgi:hypothetical protein